MISIRFFSLKIEIDLFRSVAEIIINRQNQRIFILLLRLSAVQVKRQYKSKQISAFWNPRTDQNDVIKC